MPALQSIALKLVPYMNLLIYVLLTLTCLAVLVGCALLLRRLSRKKPYGDNPDIDLPRIAQELTMEISRLTDLRNRVDPSAAVSAPGMAAGASVSSGVDVAAIERGVEAKFLPQIQDLTNKLKQAQQAAAAAAGGDTAAAMAPLQAELAKIKGELEQSKAQLEKEKADFAKQLQDAKASGGGAPAPGEATPQEAQLQKKVSVLEQALAEYEIFEEEFALVKKYKAENEELRKKLGMPADGEAAGATVTPIAAAKAPEAAPPPAAAAPAPEAAPQQNVAPTAAVAASAPPAAAAPPADANITEQDIASLFEGLDSKQENAAPAQGMEPLFAEGEAPKADAAKGEKGYVVEAVKEEPKLAAAAPVSEADAEAMAEAGKGDDLMAEFEKALGSGKGG